MLIVTELMLKKKESINIFLQKVILTKIKLHMLKLGA